MADDEGCHQHKSHHHFLVVSYGIQSHVNPARVLAHRLTQLGVDGSFSVLATLSVQVTAHRRMFPSLDGDVETTDGVISYVPHSDGLDDGSMPKDPEDRARRRRASSESLSTIVARLADRGRPVTCIISTMVLPPVLDVAREHDIPLAIYWIQPATVLAVDYHYFHGYDEVIAAHADDPAYQVCLPGLSWPLRVGSFPSFLVDTDSEMSKAINDLFRELFEYIDQWRPKILVNTFKELEENAVIEMKQHLDMFVIGPMVGSSKEERIHLFKHDDAGKKRYMEWLGVQLDRSVVYVSFGSITKQTKKQMEEIVRGLQQCGRPCLLVMRKDGLQDDDDDNGDSHSLENNAHSKSQMMVVDWCNQLDVLLHPAVGCFVSHCGWNSTIEAVASGVPVIGVPNMFDQPTNAHLVEEEWGVGVRGEHNSNGVLTGVELARCVGLVMDEGEKAMAIRERARALKELAQAAGNIGGSSEKDLLDFVKKIHAHDTVSMKKS